MGMIVALHCIITQTQMCTPRLDHPLSVFSLQQLWWWRSSTRTQRLVLHGARSASRQGLSWASSFSSSSSWPCSVCLCGTDRGKGTKDTRSSPVCPTHRRCTSLTLTIPCQVRYFRGHSKWLLTNGQLLNTMVNKNGAAGISHSIDNLIDNWYDTIWYNMLWYDTILDGTVRYGMC